MRLEKDSKGRVRVAKGDRKSRGGQYAKTTTAPKQYGVDFTDVSSDTEVLTLADYNNHQDDYDTVEAAFILNKTAYVAFGAHQPFTKAHQSIAETGKNKAADMDADFIQFTTAAFGKTSKHVLPTDLKKQLIKEAINVEPEVVQGPFQMFEKLVLKGYSKVFLLLGEDRANESVFFKAAEEYNVELTVDSVPRPAGSISGTMAREHVEKGDYNGFKTIAASNVPEPLLRSVYSEMSANIVANNSRKKTK